MGRGWHPRFKYAARVGTGRRTHLKPASASDLRLSTCECRVGGFGIRCDRRGAVARVASRAIARDAGATTPGRANNAFSNGMSSHFPGRDDGPEKRAPGRRRPRGYRRWTRGCGARRRESRRTPLCVACGRRASPARVKCDARERSLPFQSCTCRHERKSTSAFRLAQSSRTRGCFHRTRTSHSTSREPRNRERAKIPDCRPISEILTPSATDSRRCCWSSSSPPLAVLLVTDPCSSVSSHRAADPSADPI